MKDVVELCHWGYSLILGSSIREIFSEVVTFKVKIKKWVGQMKSDKEYFMHKQDHVQRPLDKEWVAEQIKMKEGLNKKLEMRAEASLPRTL